MYIIKLNINMHYTIITIRFNSIINIINYIFTIQIIRTLIRFIPKLPQQAAFCLYNYIIGYIMFYVRHPKEKGQELIGQALATLWMVVHSVQGIMFKDLKQILRKEQVTNNKIVENVL